MFACSKPAVLFIWTLSFWLLHHSSLAVTDYCAIPSCRTGWHTMCLYPNSGPSSQCQNYDPVPLSSNESAAIVAKHNELRQRVANGEESQGNPGPQPSASDMMELKWDNELATIAQRWADQCAGGLHDDCKDTERFEVGQNIALHCDSRNMKPLVENCVERWYNEVELFSKNDITVYRFDEAVGHYTQMIWANTLFIGCGRARDMSHGYNTRLVCNYGPAGNLDYEPIYKIGKSASACPRGISTSYPGLCS